MCVCVVGFGLWTIPESVRFVCYGQARRRWRVGASLRPPGVAPALRFQLYVQYVAPCRARGGCRTPVSLSGASMAQGAV